MVFAEEVKRVVAQFTYTSEDANKGVKEFICQMREGLEKDDTSLAQIPSYVRDTPKGTEKGLYLAVDLGGTNARVCSVTLNGDTTFSIKAEKTPIPGNLMVAKSSKPLFKFLAAQVGQFLKNHHDEHFQWHLESQEDDKRDTTYFQLGFTFSFPVKQIAINKGTLIRWTKGFSLPDVIGQDVCQLFQAALDELHLPVKVAALVNDSVGTLMTRSYASPNKLGAVIGAIFGTGTNGAYLEKMSNIKKPIAGMETKDDGNMAINLEWGSFDNQLNHLPNTKWDAQVDRESLNPSYHIYEKRVSGMYLGEIVRLVLLDLINNPAVKLFSNNAHTSIARDSPLHKQYGLDTAILSTAALDDSADLCKLKAALEKEIKIFSPTVEELQAVRDICNAVGRRSAKLAALPFAAILLHTKSLERNDISDIGVDGSLVEFYPHFRDTIMETLAEIDGIGKTGAKKIQIEIARDGSGVGAALIALMAEKME